MTCALERKWPIRILKKTVRLTRSRNRKKLPIGIKRVCPRTFTVPYYSYVGHDRITLFELATSLQFDIN